MPRPFPLRGSRLLALAAMSLAVLLALPPPGAVAVPFTLTNDGLFEVRAFKLNSGGGSNDNDLNDTNETYGIWQAIDGGATVPGLVTIGSKNYNVQWWETDTEVSVDYNSGGNYSVNRAYATINSDGPDGIGGDITGGDDFSVRALTYLAVPLGTWSIAIASDDGRRLQLLGLSGLATPNFIAANDQCDMGGVGSDYVGYNGTTGHNQTVGVFTVGPDDLVPGTNIALLALDGFFFERGGGDSLEISIRSGWDATWDSTGEGWTLLQDGTLGWSISSTPIIVNVTPPASSFVWDGTTNDWRDGLGVSTHWSPPNTAIATLTDDATVSSGQANVSSSDEAALNLTINGTGTVNVAAGRTLTIDSTLTLGAGGKLESDGTVNALVVVNSGGTIELRSGSLLAATGGALGDVDVVSGTASLNGIFAATTLDLSAGTTLALTGGSLTGAAGNLGGGTCTIDTASGAPVTLSNISGTGGLAKAGAGTLTLDTGNSYSGQTTVNAGILLITNGGALGDTTAGTDVNSGGQLRLDGGFTMPAGEPITIAGSGNGGAIYNLDDTNNIDGPVTLAGGATIRVDDDRLRLRGGVDLAGYALQINPDSGTTLEIRTGAVTGTGTLTKEGDGTLEIRVDSPAYTGQININNGVLDLDNRPDGLGSVATGTNVDGDATLRLRGGVTSAEPITLDGTSGGGTGEGSQGRIRNDDGTNTLAGPIAVNSASLIDVDGGTTLNLTGQLTGSGDLTKADTGRLNLTNTSNAISGLLTIAGGTLAATGVGSLGAPSAISVASGGTLEINSVGTIAAPATIAGDGYGGGGAIHSSGGDNSLTGPLTINGTTITNSAAGTTLTLSGPITLARTADLTFDGDGDIVVTQAFGNGALPTAFDGLMGMRFTGSKPASDLNFGSAGGYTVNPDGTISQTTLLLSNTPATVAMQSIAMNMDRDGASTPAPGNGPFRWEAVFGSAAAGDQSNFQIAWTGEFSPDADGDFTFRSHDKNYTGTDVDDDASIFIDVNRNGVFEASEGFVSGSGGSITVTGLLASQTYRIAIGFREGSGDEEVSYTFQGTAGAFTSETGINPGDAAQAGIFTVTLTPQNNLTKTGSGTLTLNGNNNYNGTTDVIAGTLLVTGATSNQGLYTVYGGATLGGGSIDADITVLDGGTVAPGVSPGTLTVGGDFILGETDVAGADAVYEWEFGATVSDLIALTGGDLTLNDWVLEIVDAGGEAYGWQKLYLFTGYTNLLGPNNVTFDLTRAPTWAEYTDESRLVVGADEFGVYLTGLVAIPEPGTLSLLALGALALLRRRRRR